MDLGCRNVGHDRDARPGEVAQVTVALAIGAAIGLAGAVTVAIILALVLRTLLEQSRADSIQQLADRESARQAEQERNASNVLAARAGEQADRATKQLRDTQLALTAAAAELVALKRKATETMTVDDLTMEINAQIRALVEQPKPEGT